MSTRCGKHSPPTMLVDVSTKHLLVEYNGCDIEFLDDAAKIEAMLRQAANAANATVVTTAFHRFSPQGVTGVIILEESHMSIHTWPEVGYAALDFFTCGECEPERAHEFVRRQLGATRVEVLTVRRGLPGPAASMKIVSHKQPE